MKCSPLENHTKTHVTFILNTMWIGVALLSLTLYFYLDLSEYPKASVFIFLFNIASITFFIFFSEMKGLIAPVLMSIILIILGNQALLLQVISSFFLILSIIMLVIRTINNYIATTHSIENEAWEN